MRSPAQVCVAGMQACIYAMVSPILGRWRLIALKEFHQGENILISSAVWLTVDSKWITVEDKVYYPFKGCQKKIGAAPVGNWNTKIWYQTSW